MAAKQSAKKRKGKQRKYTEEQRQQAITLALATSTYKAAKETGIPAGTIRNWIYRQQTPPEAGQAAEEAIAEAKAKATEIVIERLSGAAVSSFATAEKALLRLDELLEKKSGDRNTAAWLRSVSTTFGVAVEKALLLSNHATAAKAAQEGRTDAATEEPIEDPEFVKAIQEAYNGAKKRASERSNVTPIAARQVAKG